MRDDANLVEAAVRGDQTAFAELYERYFDRVFDFLARMVRDQAEAADLAQDTFVRAMNSLGSLAKGASFKSWLFTIARNTALNRIERSSRLQPLQGRSDDDDEPGFDVVDAGRFGNPEEAAEANALAAFVWEAARGLDPNQYAVLDLTVRQGLDSAEVAGVLGVTKNNAYVMVNRMKKSLEEAIGALMLFKTGRGSCSELDAVLTKLELGEMSPEARRLIDRHASRCEVCGDKKKRMTSPFAIFGGFAMLMPPVGAKASILEGLLQAYPYAGPPSGAEASYGQDGTGTPDWGTHSESPAPGSESNGGGTTSHTALPGADDDGGSHKAGLLKWASGAAAVAILALASIVAVSSQGDGNDEDSGLILAAAGSSTAVPATATAEPSSTPEAASPAEQTPIAAQAGPTQPAVAQPPPASTATPDAGGPPGGEAPGLTQPECTAVLSASNEALEFGPSISSLTFVLSGAVCGQPVAFSVRTDADWLEVVPASGEVPAGAAASVTVRVDRRAMPSGGSSRLYIDTAVGTLVIPVRVLAGPTPTPTATSTPLRLTIQPTKTPTPTCSANNCP